MIFLYMYHKMKHISIRACDKSKLMLNIFCFQSYICILQNWSRCDGAGSRSVMIGTREFSLSFQPYSNGSRFISPIDSHVTTCRLHLDCDNKQLSELEATSQVEYHLCLSCRDMSRT